MKREDIFSSTRIRSKCLQKAKQFVDRLLEIARGIAPVLVRAKEGLDELEYLTSDHNQIIA